MAGQLLLINPRKRRTAKKSAAPRRTAKRRVARARSAPVVVMANPRRRSAKARRSVTRSVKRRYRRNPIGGVNTKSIFGQLKSAAVGAAGGITVDVAMGYLPLPASMKTPSNTDGSINATYYAAKGALAVALGMFGKKVLPGGSAAKMAEGSLTVTMHELAKRLIPGTVTLGYMSPGMTATPGRPSNVSRLPNMAAYTAGAAKREGVGMFVSR